MTELEHELEDKLGDKLEHKSEYKMDCFKLEHKMEDKGETLLDAERSDSDVAEDMFERCVELSSDGTSLMEVTPPERPPLRFPPVANCDGKGWGPIAFSSEQAQLVASRSFLKAIFQENWTAVNNLLAYRIDLEFCDERGMTALHLAILKRHPELVRFLIGQGVDVCCVTDDGQTALHFACAHNDLRLAHLLLAIHKRNGEETDMTIHRTTKDNGDNAMHLTALHGNIRIGKRLIRAGIDFTCKNKQGDTPLTIAATFGHVDFVAMLERPIALERERNEALRKTALLDFSRNYFSGFSPPAQHPNAYQNAANFKQLTMDNFASKRRRRHIRFIERDDLETANSLLGLDPPDSPDSPETQREQKMEADLVQLRRNEEDFWALKASAASAASAASEKEIYFGEEIEEIQDEGYANEEDVEYFPSDPDLFVWTDWRQATAPAEMWSDDDDRDDHDNRDMWDDNNSDEIAKDA